jgi:hypothetical protein
MNKYLNFSFILILALFIISGCQSITTGKPFSKDDVPTPKLYINLFEPNINANTFFEYDIASQKNKIVQKKTIEEYTSFSISKLHNKIYFADKAQDNTMQLFEKDLETEKIRQLTSELSSVDFVQIDKSQSIIFMRVLLKNEYRNFHIATYKIDSGELKIWDEAEKDKSILDFNYNPHNNKLVLVSYSRMEDTQKLEKANKNNAQLLPPKYSFDIYNIDGNQIKHVIVMEKFISGVSFADDESKILFSYDEGLESPISHVMEIDVQTQKIKPVLTGSIDYKKIRTVKYDEKREGFFFLYNLYNNNNYNTLEVPKGSVLAYYDPKKKKIKDIWRSEGIIVNYSFEIR